jgi:pyruvate ferredoxin oxidoreductase gamma subunit
VSQVYEVRIHGRGGQGVVTAAELLSVAAFEAGAHAQAFPSFGSERTGAPVVAFCRIATTPIRSREPVQRPDALIVQDSTLLRSVDVFGGLRPGGWVLLNSRLTWEQLDLDRFDLRRDRVILLPATALATAHLGRPLPNAALLGGFAALPDGLVTLDGLVSAIGQRFRGGVAQGNIAAARAAYAAVHDATREVTGAPTN